MSASLHQTLVVPLHRLRRFRGTVAFGSQPFPLKVSPLTRSLVLGYHCVRLVESGLARDYSEVATKLGISQARVAQVVHLTFLAPRIQEAVLLKRALVSRKELVQLAGRLAWSDQMHRWPVPLTSCPEDSRM